MYSARWCSISTLKCFFHHISVLRSVAHCGTEDTNVINNPFSFPLQKKEEVCPSADMITLPELHVAKTSLN